MANDTDNPVPPPLGSAAPDAVLHQKPMMWPVIGLAMIIGSVALFLFLLEDVPYLQRLFFSLADVPDHLQQFAVGCGVAVGLGAVYDLIRRLKAPTVPLYLRLNRAFAYAFLLVMGLNAWMVAKDHDHIRAIAFDQLVQLKMLGVLLVLAVLFFFAVLWPLAKDVTEDLPPYQRIVHALTDTYDFVIGIERPDDWQKSEKGPRRWTILKENALWTNIVSFGAIGTGKTSQLAYPFLIQAMRKYATNDALRPSVVVLDLKGDNSLRIWELCRRLGREKDFICIRPGNELVDHQGKDLIPKDRFRTWNPLAGNDLADVRASLLSSAFQAIAKGETHQFWLDTEVQFLGATLQLLDAVKGVGNYSLFDLYMFGLDPVERDRTVSCEQARAAPQAQIYFDKYFKKFSSEDQMKLLSGFSAKLARMTGDSMRATFCPPVDSRTPDLPSFDDALLKHSGIIVFSVPEALYSTELARLLGVAFMRAFHNAMLRRTDPLFEKSGGNVKRLVLMVVDECWAYMNPGVASFTAVSRQARVCSLFLTQSLDQIAQQFRETVMANFRTRFVFPINDDATLTALSKAFGQVKESSTSVSTSENINDASHGVFTQTVKGKTQGLSRSVSTSERTVERFTATDLQHLAENRAVLHMFDGTVVRPATAIETTAYYRLPYHLLAALEHPDVGCPKSKRREPHQYKASSDGSEVCGLCGHTIRPAQRADIDAYRANFPELVPAL